MHLIIVSMSYFCLHTYQIIVSFKANLLFAFLLLIISYICPKYCWFLHTDVDIAGYSIVIIPINGLFEFCLNFLISWLLFFCSFKLYKFYVSFRYKAFSSKCFVSFQNIDLLPSLVIWEHPPFPDITCVTS